jgi:hypothetical protein
MEKWPAERPAYGYATDGSKQPLLVDMAGRLILSPLTDIGTSSTLSSVATQRAVICNPVSTLLLAANPSRKGVVLFNPTDVCYVNLSSQADDTHYVYRVTKNCSLELPGWAGAVYGCKDTTSSVVMVTEY